MNHLTKITAALAFATALTGAANAADWKLDPSHSQVVFSYQHLGYSTTYGMFSGFDGTISFDPEKPEEASVSVEIPASSLVTGWDARTEHFLGDDFFGAGAAPMITFKSTNVEVTGEMTANITGDMTVNGITKPVTLETTFAGVNEHPMAKKPWTGFTASGEVKRSDFDMGMFAPNVSDEVQLMISVEAMPAE